MSRGLKGAFICQKEGLEKKGNRSIRDYLWEECDPVNISLKGGGGGKHPHSFTYTHPSSQAHVTSNLLIRS